MWGIMVLTHVSFFCFKGCHYQCRLSLGFISFFSHCFLKHYPLFSFQQWVDNRPYLFRWIRLFCRWWIDRLSIGYFFLVAFQDTRSIIICIPKTLLCLMLKHAFSFRIFMTFLCRAEISLNPEQASDVRTTAFYYLRVFSSWDIFSVFTYIHIHVRIYINMKSIVLRCDIFIA